MAARVAIPICSLGFAIASSLVIMGGCGGKPTAPPNPRSAWRGTTVRVLMPESQELRAWLEDQRGEWSAETGAQIEITTVLIQDLVSPGGVVPGSALAELEAVAGDILIFPSTEMANVVAAGFATKLPSETSESAAMEYQDFAPAVVQHLMNWNRLTYAIPISAEPRLLYYRSDLLRDPEIRQQFEQRFGRTLRPPASWEEFDQVVEFFTGRDLDGDGVSDAGVEITSAAEAILCRAAAYGKTARNFSFYFDVNTAAPLVAGPAFQESLEKWCQLSQGVAVMTWDSEKGSMFDSSRAALALGPSHLAAQWMRGRADRTAHGRSMTIECAALPGSTRVYQHDDKTWADLPSDQLNRVTILSGMVASVTRHCQNPAALDLLTFLTTRERSMNSVASSAYGLGAIRRSHVIDAAPWIGAGWAPEPTQTYVAALRESLNSTNAVAILRIDGSEAYHQSLEEKVRAALRGEQPVAETLDAVAESWSTITHAKGLDRQRRNYRYSLGMPVIQ